MSKWYTHDLMRYGTEPTALIAQYPNVYFLNAAPAYFMPKAFEILFQQTLITLYVWLLFRVWRRLAAVTVAFVVTFALMHLPLLFFLPGPFVLFFTVAAGFGSLVFPVIIRRFKDGFVYNTYMLHFSFYLTAIGVVWLGLR